MMNFRNLKIYEKYYRPFSFTCDDHYEVNFQIPLTLQMVFDDPLLMNWRKVFL